MCFLAIFLEGKKNLFRIGSWSPSLSFQTIPDTSFCCGTYRHFLHSVCIRQYEAGFFTCACRKHVSTCQSRRGCRYTRSHFEGIHQICGIHSGIRYDDLLYWKSNRRHTRKSARSILLVGVRSNVSSFRWQHCRIPADAISGSAQ